MISARLAAAVPAHVREVCATLARAGHDAVTVGGAVRDALLGRAPKDWDVATSAHPDAVVALFRHTIPTGLAHGTVTIVTGKGVASHVEVTTFRGEGAYSDARRPDRVTFGVPLVEDLARRDFTVNAIAYDPGSGAIHDPFGGAADLERRVLRAVGDPLARFTEDGLRVMRAVRFAAQLEFAVEPATEAAIAPALPSLARVSRERVSDELRKLVATREPSRGLAIALRTGIVRSILPAVDAELATEAACAAWLDRIDRAEPRVRLAAVMAPLADRARVTDALSRLKFSNAEAALAGVLMTPPPDTVDDVAVRRWLAHVDPPARPLLVAYWAAPAPALAAAGAAILARRDPLDLGDLAITGKDLIAELALAPGPAIGRILAALRDVVLAEASANTRARLLVEARRLELELGG